MYRKVLVAIVLVAGLAMALAGTVYAQTTPMTLKLLDHNGNPLAGGAASWYTSGYGNCPGTTDANGELVCNVPNGYKFITMSVHGTSIAQNPAELALTNNTWMTAEVVIELRDSNNNLITAPNDNSGGRVQMYHGGYYTKGYTGTDGKFAIEIFPNNEIAKNPKFYLDYNWGTNSRTDVLIHAGTQTIVFKTARVQLFHSGNINIYAGGFKAFTKPAMELLPGTYDFRFSGYNPADFVVPPAGISKLVNVLVLKDSNNADLNGGTARGGMGMNFGNWHVSGPTVNGVLFDIRDAASQPGQMSYEMKFNNTTQVKTQDVFAASIFKFKTVLLTLRLETCGTAPLSGGGARYGAGNSYTTWHFPGGATNGSGETMAQVLPGGQYSFAMGYQGTEQAYPGNPVTIPGSNTTLTWQTTRVEVTWPGHISYGGGTGDAAHFKTSTEVWPGTPVVTAAKELMPGTVRFHFRPVGSHPGYTRDITFGGCYHHAGYMTLNDNNFTPMANLSFPDKPENLMWLHQCNGNWGSGKPQTPVTTDAYGKIPFDMTCSTWGNLRMVLNQTSITYPNASIAALTHYTWQAAKVNVEFKDVNGAPMAGGTVAQQGSYWYTHGTTDGVGPLSFYTFPTNAGTIKVRVSYNLSSQDKTLAVLASPPAPSISTVTFQLGTVTIGSCVGPVSIPRGGSHGGNFNAGDVISLMPGTYNYNGCGGGSVTVTEGQNSLISPP